MLTCRELVEEVTDYLEGRMPLWHRLQFDLHLMMCGTCRAYVQQMREAVLLLGELPPPRANDALTQAALERFRTWRLQPTSPTAGDGDPG
jgi:anti-sigma factor RsiW